MLVSAEGGKPVEFFLEAGATNDNAAFKDFELDLPAGSFTPTSSTTTTNTRIC